LIFLLDAAQTIGTMPLYPDELGVDLLAFPGHKGLMGPLGTGLLYHAPRMELRSVREGGTGSRSEEAMQPQSLPDRLESGSHNLVGIAGLQASVGHLLQVGLQVIHDHKQALTELFLMRSASISGLRLHGPSTKDNRVAVFSVTLAGWSPIEAGEELDRRHNIKARAGLHCAPLAHQTFGTERDGTLRLSFGSFNTLEDVERVCLALEDLLLHREGLTAPPCITSVTSCAL
jgi:selenocysteine lyase/cysteine desulfurase